MYSYLSRIISALILLSLAATSIANEVSYSFGVVPQQSAKQLAKLWTPVFRHIQNKTGIKLQFNTAKNIPEFEKRLAEGTYDFAYMNPYHFTVFNREPGYRSLAVRINQPIRGIVVVRKDSQLTTLSDLSGETLVFPSPAAFAASVLPRAQLTNDKIPYKAKYVSSHDSVYLNVAKGLFPAGGGVKRTFNNTSPKVKEQLKVLWTTKPYTPHAITAHPRINQNVYDKVQQAFVDMSNNPDGQVLLKSLKIKKGLAKALDSDWDDVRGLGLDLLDSLINQ
jgi:phosphonate transport system substrate-binding protein